MNIDSAKVLIVAANIIVPSTFALERKESWLNRPNIFSVIEKPFSVGQIKDAAFSVLASPQTKEER